MPAEVRRVCDEVSISAKALGMHYVSGSITFAQKGGTYSFSRNLGGIVVTVPTSATVEEAVVYAAESAATSILVHGNLLLWRKSKLIRPAQVLAVACALTKVLGIDWTASYLSLNADTDERSSDDDYNNSRLLLIGIVAASRSINVSGWKKQHLLQCTIAEFEGQLRYALQQISERFSIG